MKELIGTCTSCSKEVFCLDGFFNGVHTDEKELYCFECYEGTKKMKIRKVNLCGSFFIINLTLS